MPLMRLDGQIIFYTRPNRNGGPTLLLVHGAGGSHLDWPKEIRRLYGVDILNLDLPGHGRAPGKGCDTVDAYANVVQDFATAMSLDTFYVAGHSLGGAVALTLALRDLAILRGIILIATGGHLPVSDRLLSAVLTDKDSAAAIITRYGWALDAPAELSARGHKRLRQVDAQVLEGDFRACAAFDIRERLASVAVPALVIGAESDKMTPLEMSRFVAARIPNSQLIIVPGAGHYVTLEHPELVAGAMREFIRQNE